MCLLTFLNGNFHGKNPRHSSGLFLLATTETCVARIRRSLNRAKNQGRLPDNYIAVTKALPRMDGVTETIDVVMTKVGIREPLKPGKKHMEVQHSTIHILTQSYCIYICGFEFFPSPSSIALFIAHIRWRREKGRA